MIPLFARVAASNRAAYAATILSDIPLAYWRLGDASGTTAADDSGNSYNGTYIDTPTLGATGLITGDPNTGVSFSGIGTQRIDVGAVAALINLSRNFSIEWWMKPTNVTAYQAIYSSGLSGANGGVLIRINTTGGFDILQDNHAQLFSIAASLAVNTRYHCVFTMDSSGNYVFYLNNVSIGSGNTSAVFAGSYITIAADSNRNYSGTVNDYFHGELDEVAVYGSALSSVRVAAHYNAGV